MITVVSPAKKLSDNCKAKTNSFKKPEFLNESQELINQLKSLSPIELEGLMGISEKLALLNWERIQNWNPNFSANSTQEAVFSFKGDTYVGLDAESLDKNEIKFVSYSKNIKPEIEKIHNQLKVKRHTRMKSSLKFCVIAAGEYDGYVAEPRAYEWDIAAGHAILKHAGGSISDFNGNEILYGKKDFKNPSIILKSKNIL